MIDLSAPATDVAPSLLGATIWHGPVGVRLTEVEAYMGLDDPASHAFRGPTPRARVMFGPPSHVYVYLSYGIHRCVNLVCSPDGVASAVLLRGGRVVAGENDARLRRGGVPENRLACGPGNMGSALGATLDESGDPVELISPVATSTSGWRLQPADHAVEFRQGPRVGISRNVNAPWRWWIPRDPTVSGPRK
ncbi:DNA-3-methyladenine glycosylase [Cutibacterium sp. V947]|uniref:DNA-3-methyladenine glycosylase n=1 Tax=unclassified Cutibacterium TaxID=2649671 RepID=UPI003EE3BCC9